VKLDQLEIEMKPTDRGSAAVSAEAGRDPSGRFRDCTVSATKAQMCNAPPIFTRSTSASSWTTSNCRRSPPCPLGGFKLLLSGPGASGSRPMPDGRRQEAGGWNRIVLHVTDVAREIERLKKSGLKFRNEMETGPGGRQIQLEDPDGNPIELFEPARRE
jgi:catechol 2,3-dioxygenase-like lactoylglutathione lyase family enzyme